eukprot:scaffold246_cov242-Pinguiococcus_pyrenoidosus.AAC.23
MTRPLSRAASSKLRVQSGISGLRKLALMSPSIMSLQSETNRPLSWAPPLQRRLSPRRRSAPDVHHCQFAAHLGGHMAVAVCEHRESGESEWKGMRDADGRRRVVTEGVDMRSTETSASAFGFSWLSCPERCADKPRLPTYLFGGFGDGCYGVWARGTRYSTNRPESVV